jgi:hypothetical protein
MVRCNVLCFLLRRALIRPAQEINRLGGDESIHSPAGASASAVRGARLNLIAQGGRGLDRASRALVPAPGSYLRLGPL